MPFDTGQGHLFDFNHVDFDFNIQFEQLFLSLLPSVLFIVASSWRALSQLRKPTLVETSLFQWIKLGAIGVYLCLELALLVLAASSGFQASSVFLASSVLKVVSGLAMIALSLADHNKSPRPSILLAIYLSLTLLPDATQARTLFLSSDNKSEITYSSIFCTALASKILILFLEAKKKTDWLDWDRKFHSPEEVSSIFSLGVFAWLNKMFLDGYQGILTIDDLYPLDSALNGETTHGNFSTYLDYSKMKDEKYGLAKVLLRILKGPFLLPVIPRLALLAFTFCQPLFIESLLDHLSRSELDANVGYGFIGASVLIYSGIAISTALYWTTQARLGSSKDSAAVTLMSTDMERIDLGFRSLHETWACMIQAALASWLLYKQIGVLFVAPIGVVLASFAVLMVSMKFAGDSQRSWMAGVQKRVGLTATVIGSMKTLKLSGLAGAVSDFIQALRVEELAAGSRFRKLSIVAAVLGFLPLLISPPLTFAFTQRTLNVSRIFTSLSYLTLLTSPLAMIFQAVPQLLSGLACLGRVQAYLECETREDFRRMNVRQFQSPEKTANNPEAAFDLQSDSQWAIVVRDAAFGWEADKNILQHVSVNIMKSTLTIVVGAVGTGKSTFCKALLGEIPYFAGDITLNTHTSHFGVCEQTAFLSNGSVRENIIGFSPYDHQRYEEVIHATVLAFDIDTLPQGDATNIGSDGITLSGGQRQRVSLARALYLHTDLLVLDDVFSGLDAGTQEKVFDRVFGPCGLVRRRGTTVVLWLTYWANDVYKTEPDHTWAFYAGLYAFFQVCGLLSLLTLGLVIIIASVQRVGARIVTNFFSQDLNLIDTELPSALLNFLFATFSAIAQAAIMPTSSPYMAISYPFLATLLHVVQRFYLRTARQLRLLDLEAKSPLYTHFLDTAKGITTIRAFGFLTEETNKNSRLVNDSLRPAYLLVMVQQWLTLVLDVVVMILAAVLTTLAVRLHSNSGFTGAALVTLMSFGDSMSSIVIFYTKLETSIGAISRLKVFSETVQPEDKLDEDVNPHVQWPQSGRISLNDVSASYAGTDDSSEGNYTLALQNITLNISPGEKVAICGRTGSGKSSLMALFLKLLDATSSTSANIIIDDIPLYRIKRPSLRQRILAVPQEAVFLPDGTTFMANLDPLNVATIGDCQSVLESVGLWNYVLEKGGLTAPLSAGTLSAGQRQLLSLARVLIRKRDRTVQGAEGGILLLDEVSSSVDHTTERLMQEIIDAQFTKYTVVAVSHRLDMIMDFDRVVVMDKGEIVEIGQPRTLAEQESSRFGELVRASA
ncbi:multidrug resistance-like protein [Aureobasidium subglaciale]|nr:multidrug resistance-like protein [Aureobasidium subglaciale]